MRWSWRAEFGLWTAGAEHCLVHQTWTSSERWAGHARVAAAACGYSRRRPIVKSYAMKSVPLPCISSSGLSILWMARREQSSVFEWSIRQEHDLAALAPRRTQACNFWWNKTISSSKENDGFTTDFQVKCLNMMDLRIRFGFEFKVIGLRSYLGWTVLESKVLNWEIGCEKKLILLETIIYTDFEEEIFPYSNHVIRSSF